MLDAQVLVLHALRAVPRRHQRLFHVVGDIDFVRFPAATRHLGLPGDHRLQAGSDLLRLLAHLGQKLRDQALRIGKQRVRQMLLGDLLVLIFNGQLLRGSQRLTAFFCKLLIGHIKRLLRLRGINGF